MSSASLLIAQLWNVLNCCQISLPALSDLGTPSKVNWYHKACSLLAEMSKGLPIRDASVNPRILLPCLCKEDAINFKSLLRKQAVQCADRQGEWDRLKA